MIKTVIRFLWSLLKLPITLIRLPFRIFSAVVSLVMYVLFAIILGAGVYVFVL
jgi:hypothetical protein